jgi:hypothetical protein
MLLVVDGQLHLQAETQVTGTIYLLDGILLLDGAVDGDIFLVGGALTVGEEAMVAGDLTQAGGTLVLAPGALVEGHVQRGSDVELTLRPEWSEQSTSQQLLWSLAQALGLAILAAVIVRLAPQPVHRVADAVVEHPVAAAALGILVGIVAPSLLVMMAFTLILIPVTAVGLIVGGAVIAYGLIAWGVIVGAHFGQILARGTVPSTECLPGDLALYGVDGSSRSHTAAGRYPAPATGGDRARRSLPHPLWETDICSGDGGGDNE